MNNKTRNRMFMAAGIVLLSLVLYFKPFSRTEIIILDHLTEMNDDGVENQIVLVKNPPYLSSTLELKIEEFNKTNPVEGKYFRRLFIKEQDKIWFPSLTLRDNIDYESTKITRYDLDNIDFLATSRFYLNKHGSIYRNTKSNTGELWYYKY